MLPFFTYLSFPHAIKCKSQIERRNADVGQKWKQNFNYLPDALVVEGPKAGGHLGFKADQLDQESNKLENLVSDVLAVTVEMKKKYNKDIPVIAAGGIYTGDDMYQIMHQGAAAVQLGTRFVATEECDASDNFKNAFIKAKEKDVQIIKSPVGMPGRAIRNKFLIDLEKYGKLKIKCPYRCLTACKIENAKYCIAKALLNSYFGDVDHGLIFCGQNAYRTNKINSTRQRT